MARYLVNVEEINQYITLHSPPREHGSTAKRGIGCRLHLEVEDLGSGPAQASQSLHHLLGVGEQAPDLSEKFKTLKCSSAGFRRWRYASTLAAQGEIGLVYTARAKRTSYHIFYAAIIAQVLISCCCRKV